MSREFDSILIEEMEDDDCIDLITDDDDTLDAMMEEESKAELNARLFPVDEQFEGVVSK